MSICLIHGSVVAQYQSLAQWKGSPGDTFINEGGTVVVLILPNGKATAIGSCEPSPKAIELFCALYRPAQFELREV